MSHAVGQRTNARRRNPQVGAALFVAVMSVVLVGAVSPAVVLAQDAVSDLDAALALQDTLATAIERAEKSVVAIARVRRDAEPPRARFEDGRFIPPDEESDPLSPDFIPNDFAAGVVVDRGGLILTNYHVLGEIDKNDYYVWVAGKPYEARASVEAADPWTDMAVLRIEADDLEPITLGDSSSLKKGHIVITLGNPYGIARDGRVSAGWGIVSNLARKAPPLPSNDRLSSGKETLHHYGTLIQTDAKLNLGTSGGALVNLKGEMVGLTTSLAALSGYERSAGFAIPVDDTFRRTLEQLKKGRLVEVGFLGVAPQHLAAQDRRDGQTGARVSQVVPGTPAARAGIRPGDVITQVNRSAIDDANALLREVSSMPAGSRAVLNVTRGRTGDLVGSTREVTVTLGKKYVSETRPAFARNAPQPWRGMSVDYATALPMSQLHERAWDIDPAGCIAVIDVVPDSPAWKAGMRPWTFVSHVGSSRVETPQEFYAAVATANGGVRLRIAAGRGGEPRTVSVAP